MSVHTEPTDPDRQVRALGTILSIWAHPDDETYLAGGVMAAARRLGNRVVCASATAGERGAPDPSRWPPARLGRVRRWEHAASMAVLGVDEHLVGSWPDGDLDLHHEEGVAWADELLGRIAPDTVITFGPDGMTFHPDHIAVHRWVTRAWHQRGRRGRLLYATSSTEHLVRFRELYERSGVYMTDQRPVGVPESDLALHLELGEELLDQKLAALRAMATQTAATISSVGEETFAMEVAEESFVAAAATTAVPTAARAATAASAAVAVGVSSSP